MITIQMIKLALFLVLAPLFIYGVLFAIGKLDDRIEKDAMSIAKFLSIGFDACLILSIFMGRI